MTRGQYTTDQRRRGPKNPSHGAAHHKAKLNEETVASIRRMYENGDASQRALARMFGVTQPNIQQIVSGKTWRHESATSEKVNM